jgi:Lrp/AsnC family transcriptional regulator, leucine-responsive regulatory protein
MISYETKEINMDEIDYKIVEVLMQQGRITWAELGNILGMSAPAAAERVRQLEAQGVIKHFAAQIDPLALDYSLAAFIAVSLARPEHRDGFLVKVQELPEVQECHHVTGDDDYWLKVRCTSTSHLDWLLREQLKSLPGVLRTRTTIILSTAKETSAVPLPQTSAYIGK